MKDLLINYWLSSGIVSDERILKAFRETQRENFLPPGLEREAYSDYPLKIGHGQTISQPTTVMIMTQLLDVKEGHNVLEVGSGSGYQAAIIARLAGPKGRVVTSEIIPELAAFARNNIERQGIGNVRVVHGDGGLGYSKYAPYDRIIVTAACPRIPKELALQLKEGGILVAPVGDSALGQDMIRATKEKGVLIEENFGKFVFVPLRGERGY